MDYSLITEQQFQKRFDILPDILKDALSSESDIKSVRQICRAHYLNDEEKILIVEQLTGLVILGFVLPDDLSQEISENLHLDKKHVDDIASEIDRKIFSPIKSDLEKVYSPCGAAAVGDFISKNTLLGSMFREAKKATKSKVEKMTRGKAL